MTDYKKQYIKYKLKYLLLKQKNLQFKQKAGSLPTSHSIENMFSEIIDYIKNLKNSLFSEEEENDLVGLDDILNESDIEYEDVDEDEAVVEDSDEDDYEDGTLTPPSSTPPSIGTRTPPRETDNGPFGAGHLNILGPYIPPSEHIHTLNQ